MDAAHADFETRSEIDLKKVGLYVYANHPTTDVWCMGYAIGNGEPRMWRPDQDGWDCPDDLALHVLCGGIVVAHNAQFEYQIWQMLTRRHNWPVLDIAQMRCTMAASYAMSMPGSLEMAGAALGLPIGKDKAGHALMMKMARPYKFKDKANKAGPIWLNQVGSFVFQGEKHTGAWALDRLCAYCLRDVEVEREIDKRQVRLSPREQDLWVIDQRINERGIPIDMAAVEGGRTFRDSVVQGANNRMNQVTNGYVAKTTSLPALKLWLEDYGVFAESLDKDSITVLAEHPGLPAEVVEALGLRQQAGRATSVKKLDVMALQGYGDRVRYAFQYHGGRTGRWAGRSVQPHNDPRDLPEPAIVDSLMLCLARGNVIGMSLDDISKCLRGFVLAPEGYTLCGGDFSNIEGRGVAWVAGEDSKLEAFAECDEDPSLPDIYEQTFAVSFGCAASAVTKDERQVGKVQELAFGYQGGVGACQQFAQDYGLDIEDDTAEEWKVAWRFAHPRIVDYWKAIQNAAIDAVSTGKQTACGPIGRQVKFKVAGSFLWCLLPSGRVLCYPYPDVRPGKWDNPMLTYKSVPSAKEWKEGRVIKEPDMSRNWARVSTYGGKLTENVVQAICRDILAEAIVYCEQQGLPVVKHVHDEVIVQVPVDDPQFNTFLTIMNTQPQWAAGFPVRADCWQAPRYQK